jgi:hypothetical protein
MKNILIATMMVLGLGLTGCCSWKHHGGECAMHSAKCGSCDKSGQAQASEKCAKCGKMHADCADCKKMGAGMGECPMTAAEGKDTTKEASKEAPKK